MVICDAIEPGYQGKTYFGELKRGHLMLEDPEVVQGRRALHLRFKVRR